MYRIRKNLLVLFTVWMVVLGVAGGVLLRFAWPGGYFACYPAVPVCCYLSGVCSVGLFRACGRRDPRQRVTLCMLCKAAKLLLSVLLVGACRLWLGECLPAFAGTLAVFYLVALVFETRIFFQIEVMQKRI